MHSFVAKKIRIREPGKGGWGVTILELIIGEVWSGSGSGNSPQGLACPGASADFANTDEQILLLPFSGLAAETCLTKKQRVSMCLTDPGRGRASSKLADLGPILEGIVGGYFEKLAGG